MASEAGKRRRSTSDEFCCASIVGRLADEIKVLLAEVAKNPKLDFGYVG